MHNIDRDRFLAWAYAYSCLAFSLYLFRDALTGAIRYFFSLIHLDVLWFVPDGLAFGSLAIYALYQGFIARNPFGILLMINFVTGTIISIIFMNDNFFSFFATVKMFIPVFVGLCFFDRSITENKKYRVFVFLMFIFSAIGLILSPYVDYPWLGQKISSFGVEREASKLWWQGGEVRYGGFAGDSTMAAFVTAFCYIMISNYWGFIANTIFFGIAYWAIDTSTSKTAIGVLVVFYLLYAYTIFLRSDAKRLAWFRLLGRFSFICVLVPPFLMITLGGVDLAAIDEKLMSLADRINNTWQLPFKHLVDIFPMGLFTGCGLGCFAYPMDYNSMAQWNVPFDNFYMSTSLMLGYPFVILVIYLYWTTNKLFDVTKLALILAFNIYSVTVQCYGPSFATLVWGYIFSEALAIKGKSTQTAMSAREWNRRAIRNSQRPQLAQTSAAE